MTSSQNPSCLRSRLPLARRLGVLAAACALAPAAMASAAQAPPESGGGWTKVGCTTSPAGTSTSGLQLCVYKSGRQVQGQFTNRSGYPVKNQGHFDATDYQHDSQYCANTTTQSGVTVSCTRTLAPGAWRVALDYDMGSRGGGFMSVRVNVT